VLVPAPAAPSSSLLTMHSERRKVSSSRTVWVLFQPRKRSETVHVATTSAVLLISPASLMARSPSFEGSFPRLANATDTRCPSMFKDDFVPVTDSKRCGEKFSNVTIFAQSQSIGRHDSVGRRLVYAFTCSLFIALCLLNVYLLGSGVAAEASSYDPYQSTQQ
jgi:hypothetical protein